MSAMAIRAVCSMFLFLLSLVPSWLSLMPSPVGGQDGHTGATGWLGAWRGVRFGD